LQGDNSDGAGLMRDLSRFIDLQGKSILLLGAGGAASGVIEPLQAKNPASITIANRTIAKAQDLQKIFPQVQVCDILALDSNYDLVLNATVANASNQLPSLLDKVWRNKPFCYDLSYSQKTDTPFVACAKDNRCKAVDGIGMLIEQAAESFYIWYKVRPDTALTRRLLSLLAL
jgi:shikimate dehydrogenase